LKKIIAICICSIWMIVIFCNSSDNGEISQQKSYYLLNLIKVNYKSIVKSSSICNEINSIVLKICKTNKIDEKSDKIIRKTAHVFEYFMLAAVISAVLFSFNFTGENAVIYIMFLCLFCSVTDEFHQSFVPGRTSKVSDILIDFCGSIIGMFIFYLFYYKIYQKLK